MLPLIVLGPAKIVSNEARETSGRLVSWFVNSPVQGIYHALTCIPLPEHLYPLTVRLRSVHGGLRPGILPHV